MKDPSTSISPWLRQEKTEDSNEEKSGPGKENRIPSLPYDIFRKDDSKEFTKRDNFS